MPNTPEPEFTELQMADASGVAAALEAARPHVFTLAPDHAAASEAVLITARRSDHAVDRHDLERYLPTPQRARGTVQAFTADGFATAVKQRVDEGHADALYADSDACRLVCVLNDDEGDVAGWRDHRVVLALRPTPEWEHWTSHQGLLPQETFAEIIEAGQDEIIGTPGPVEMLELAQKFEVSIGGKFRQESRLANGTVQLVWEETHEAKVGAGLVDVPKTFTVSVAPFYGAKARPVEARIRYTCRGGHLRIGYVLHRPDEIKREAFATDVVDRIVGVTGALKGHPLIEGAPADQLRPRR